MTDNGILKAIPFLDGMFICSVDFFVVINDNVKR